VFGGHMEGQPDRRLTIVFHPSDDTMAIHETPARGTGLLGGRFLRRQRVKRPIDGNATLSKEAPCYTVEDLVLGSRLNVNSHIVILDKMGDGRARDPEDPDASIDPLPLPQRFRLAMAPRRARLADLFRSMDADHDGHVTLPELRDACRQLNLPLSDPELSRVMASADTDGNGTLEFPEFVRLMAPPDPQAPADASDFPLTGAAGCGVDPQSSMDAADPTPTSRAEGDHLFKMFRAKLLGQRYTTAELFRLVVGRNPDGLLGRQELNYALDHALQMHLTPRQRDLLARRVLPHPDQRLSLRDFVRVLDGAPHFEATTK